MKPVKLIHQVFHTPAEAFAAGAGGVALFVLASWLLGGWRFAALGSGYVPMAPSTAVLLLLLSCTLFLCRRRPSGAAVGWLVMSAATGALLVSLLVWACFLLGTDLPLERWLVPDTTGLDGIPVGRMSPLTATVFLTASLAMLCQSPFFARRRLWRQTSALLALFTLLTSLVVLLSYGAEAPVLYGNDQTIPMALPTAIAFTLLAGGILLGAGNDTWPLSLFAPRTAHLQGSVSMEMAGGPLAAFLVLSLAIGVVGSLYLKKQIALYRQAAGKELSAIAELKTGQIARWYAERQDDAQILFHNTLTQPQLHNYLAGSGNAPTDDEILKWMNYRQQKAFRRMILFDAKGTPRLWSPSDKPLPHHDYRNELQAVLTAHKVLTTDLHRDESDGQQQEINLNVWLPINGTGSGSAGTAGGALLLQVDPQRFLYPLIQTWPTPSNSAETLLVRREGNEVVYLNRLRHRTDTAFSLRFPLDFGRNLPAAMAVTGHTGVVEGIDYRNVTVLASMCAIPGTPWFMVAKVDREEVYAPLRQQAVKTGIIMLTMILATALGVGLLWQQRGNQLLQQQLTVELERSRAEEALQESERRLRRAEAVAHLGHWRLDLVKELVTWSDEIYRIFGVTREAFQPTPESYATLIHPDDREIVEGAEAKMRSEGAAGFDFRIVRPDGALRYLGGKGELESDATGTPLALFGTMQDTTELRQKERELQDKNAELERFTYTISHDLKSPLVTVKTFLGFLEQDLASGDSGRIGKDMLYIRTAADKMRRLLDELLEMSRIGRVINPPVKVTFRELVEEAVGMVAGGIAERGVAVQVADEALNLYGDRSRLVEIWQNLVENAVKFMGNQPEPRIEIGVQRQGRDTVFFVRDNGMGIDPRYREKVFGLFEKLDPQTEGTGLGLALIKRIVEFYGGSIGVEATGPGPGVCFRFTLPKAVTHTEKGA